MGDMIFHAGIGAVYGVLAIEAWRLRHRRMACCYGLAAALSLGFATVHLAWPISDGVALWA